MVIDTKALVMGYPWFIVLAAILNHLYPNSSRKPLILLHDRPLARLTPAANS